MIERAAADAIARLEHDDGPATSPQSERRRQPGKPGADDDHVDTAAASGARYGRAPTEETVYPAAPAAAVPTSRRLVSPRDSSDSRDTRAVVSPLA